MRLQKKSIYLLFLIVIIASCNTSPEPKELTIFDLTDTIIKLEIKADSGVKINDSVSYYLGYGSSMTKHPTKENYYYLLTDRGPNFGIYPDKTNLFYNFELEETHYQGFADTNFVPVIGLFFFDGEQFILEKNILLSNEKGEHLNGITTNMIATETPVVITDSSIVLLKRSDRGIDCEGMAAATDGTFWICDEYEPAIFHFDKDGKMLHKRINPYESIQINGVNIKLPSVYSKRQPNAGLEGIATTKNDSVLFCVVQRPLANFVDKENKNVTKKSQIIRICSLNLFTGETKEFVYVTENSKTYISEMRAISDTTFLVIERDGKNPTEEESQKYIYRVTVSQNVTNINSADDNEFGKLFDNKTIEELSFSKLEKNNIISLKKELLFDITKEIPDFNHEKVEGIELVGNKILFVNDNDFSINFDHKTNTIIQSKTNNEVKKCFIYMIDYEKNK